MNESEKIIKFEEIFNLKLNCIAPSEGKNKASLGFSQMLGKLCGHNEYDGYLLETSKHKYHVLIDNGQSCCESWGYFYSNDDADYFINSELKEVNLTDLALNKKKAEEAGYYEDGGGIQFVDFVTDKGVFQLAVYNAHNGYYGHPILIIKDMEILLNDTI